MERWHKTLRREFLNGKVFGSIDNAQNQVDGWVREYNFDRRHQGIGDVVPWERFRVVGQDHAPEPTVRSDPSKGLSTTRKVNRDGRISFACQLYKAGVWLASETVDISVDAGLVAIHHRGILVATHAQRHRPARETKALARRSKRDRDLRRRPHQPTTGQAVTRKGDSSGGVSFAGATYKAGMPNRGRQVQVAIVDDTSEIAAGGELIRVHPIKHDRSREHGAVANAGSRPSRINAARTHPQTGTQQPKPNRNTPTGT